MTKIKDFFFNIYAYFYKVMKGHYPYSVCNFDMYFIDSTLLVARKTAKEAARLYDIYYEKYGNENTRYKQVYDIMTEIIKGLEAGKSLFNDDYMDWENYPEKNSVDYDLLKSEWYAKQVEISKEKIEEFEHALDLLKKNMFELFL